MIKYISLDLQGTLTDSKFSDNFWLEILPNKYSQCFNITIDEAKNMLKNKFKEYGVYNILYYDDKYWSKYLKFDTKHELNLSQIKPQINKELYNYISTLNLPKIIISTTTNLFINEELKDKIKIFDKIYSCVDYFNVGGKTENVYKAVCKELNIKPSEMLHIGDNKVMDIENAKKAGVNTILFQNDTENVIKEIKNILNEGT